MRKNYTYASALMASLLLASCASEPTQTIDENEVKRAPLTALATPLQLLQDVHQQVSTNVKSTAQSILYMELKVKSNSGGGSESLSICGFVLDKKGHLIAYNPGLPDNAIQGCTVTINENEYNARLVKKDATHKFLLLKLDDASVLDSIAPTTFGEPSALKPGEFVVSMHPTNAQFGYEPIISIGNVKTTIEGKTDLIIASGLDIKNIRSSAVLGSPLLTLDNRVVGFLGRGGFIMSDTVEKKALKYLRKKADGTQQDEGEEPWMGLLYQPVTQDMTDALGLPRQGLLVMRVIEGAPIAVTGLRNGDCIIAIDGKKFTKRGIPILSQTRKWLDQEIGRECKMTYLRDGKQYETAFTYKKRPKAPNITIEEFGITVKDITSQDYFAYELPQKKGVLVTAIEQGSAASTSTYFGQELISNGDIILEVNEQPVKNISELRDVIRDLRTQEKKAVLIKLLRGHYSSYVSLNTSIGQKIKSKKFED